MILFRRLTQRRLGTGGSRYTAVAAAMPTSERRVPCAPPALRIHNQLWQQINNHLDDDQHGEQAGIILISAHHSPGTSATEPQTLLSAHSFLPITDEYVISRRFGLDYDARFHLAAARRADALGTGMLLVHSHGDQRPPQPSRPDRERGAVFLTFAARRLPTAVHGLLILGGESTTATFSYNGTDLMIAEIVITGTQRRRFPVAAWHFPRLADTPAVSFTSHDPDRQALAFGAPGTRTLSRARIAVVGVSGGGSHVTQQLIHAGAGTLIPIDPQTVEATNVRRLVMSTDSDIDRTRKVDLPARLATGLHAGATKVYPMAYPFPSDEAIAALRATDLIIGCVDGWDTRDDLNAFALDHRIPYIDIAATITPTDGVPRVSGQIAIVLPGGPCLRCMHLVTDARVEASRRQRQGYLDGEPDPQVVSINGTLASEAVTAALLLVTTPTASVEPRRNYRYPPGRLLPMSVEKDPECIPCRRAGLA